MELREQVRVIAMDLDGTLLRTDKTIGERTKKALMRAQERGIRLVLASGRHFRGVFGFAQELELRKYGGFIIGINGGQVYDCKNEKMVSEIFMDDSLMREYIDAWKSRLCPADSVGIMAYTDGVLFSQDPEAHKVRSAAEHNHLELRVPEQFPEDIDRSALKVIVAGKAEIIQPIRRELEKEFEGRIYLTHSSPDFIEAMPYGMDKGRGIRILCEHLGFGADRVAAFGDGDNDVPMLETAGAGVAMGNAEKHVLELADYVTGTNDEEGIAEFLETYVLSN